MARDQQTLSKIHLPHWGRWHFSKNPKSDKIIIFVHHYGGNENSPAEHVELVNELGFHAVTFLLRFSDPPYPKSMPWNSEFELGYMNVWREQIQDVFSTVPGKKIAFGFSTGSAAMLAALAERRCMDFDRAVVDSGPVLNDFHAIVSAMLTRSSCIPKPYRFAMPVFQKLIFGRNFKEKTEEQLTRIPSTFPILSVRSWKDDVTPISAIDRYFDLAPHLELEVFCLRKSQHLKALSRHEEEYQERVGDFLSL